MPKDVGRDHLAIIRIEGMHCHKCEQTIQRALLSNKGVHEVEVDFASGQASVLFDKSAVAVKRLVEAIEAAGYRTAGVTQKKTASPSPSHARQTHA
jgi:copper chaperone CopZ